MPVIISGMFDLLSLKRLSFKFVLVPVIEIVFIFWQLIYVCVLVGKYFSLKLLTLLFNLKPVTKTTCFTLLTLLRTQSVRASGLCVKRGCNVYQKRLISLQNVKVFEFFSSQNVAKIGHF